MASDKFLNNVEKKNCAFCSNFLLESNLTKLSCEHTICEACLHDLTDTNGQIICCVCQENNTLPSGGVFKINKERIRDSLEKIIIKEKKRIKQQKESTPLCTTCFRDRMPLETAMTKKEEEERAIVMKNLGENKLKNTRNELEKLDGIKKSWIKGIEEQFEKIKLEIVSLKSISLGKTGARSLNDFPIEISEREVRVTILNSPPKIQYKLDEIETNPVKQLHMEKRKSLNLDGKYDSLTNIQKNIENLSEWRNIETVNFSNIPDLGKELPNIFNSLQNSNHCLRELKFNNCNLNEEVCFSISSLLMNCSKIQTFEMKANRNIGNGLNKICQYLHKSSSTLKVLNFYDCDLDAEHCKDIADLLMNCSKIEKFNVGKNPNVGTELNRICQQLQNSSNILRIINFFGCNFDENKCERIVNLLKNCSNIKDFYLGINSNIGNDLIRRICEQLQKSSKTLKIISFEKWNLDDNKCKYIVNLLMKCSNIEQIGFGYNPNIEREMERICKSLERSSNILTRVTFRDCNLDEYRCGFIGNLLMKCSRIKVASFGGNKMMGEGWKSICKGLQKSSRSLEQVEFIHCDIKVANIQLIKKQFGDDVVKF